MSNKSSTKPHINQRNASANILDDFSLCEFLNARGKQEEWSGQYPSCEEFMIATLDRIEERNPKLKALIAVRPRDELVQEARRCDQEMQESPNPLGKLHGIPIAVKDLSNVAGLPTTMGGSPLFWNTVPKESDLFVEKMQQAGAIVLGKSNAPELGVGSHTFNKRWGTTVNPYDTTKSAGGSSGGAAVAVATRMLCVADGSDMMGSLRNPAGWNNIYSHRPTAGMIEERDNPQALPVNPLDYPISTAGPMARSPMDCALLLEVMAGKEKFSMEKLRQRQDIEGMKIAWLGDWGGAMPMEDGILPLCQESLAVFSSLGVHVEHLDEPVYDLKELWKSWTTIRSKVISANFPQSRILLQAFLWLAPVREELKWEIRRGMDISVQDLKEAASIARHWSHCLENLFSKYDALALPTAQTWAFPAEWRWPKQIAGKDMDTYHRWMEVAMPISLGGLPCTTIPAGFGSNGLCMGVQLAGKRLDDGKVITLAEAYHLQTSWPQEKTPVF